MTQNQEIFLKSMTKLGFDKTPIEEIKDPLIYSEFEKELESLGEEVNSQVSYSMLMTLEMLDQEFGVKVSLNEDIIPEWNRIVSDITKFIIESAVNQSIKERWSQDIG